MNLRIYHYLLPLIILSLSATMRAQETEKKINMTPIEIKQIDTQKALIIKADVPTNAIGEKMGECYGKLFAFLAKQNSQPAGPPFAVYHSFDLKGNTVFEIGVPVSSEMHGSDDIEYKEYPDMKAVTSTYTGAYENMIPVYENLKQYMDDHQLVSTETSWEVYLTNPNEVQNPDDNQTIIYFPLKNQNVLLNSAKK